MNCRECGTPLFDGRHPQMLCDGCEDRAQLYQAIFEADHYGTAGNSKTLSDLYRGY